MRPRNLTPGAALAALLGLWILVFVLDWAEDPAAPSGPEWMPPPYLPDVNTAPPGHLLLLPGIGPNRARAIERERRSGGPFDRLDDLQRIHGIGPVTVLGLRGRARAALREGDP